MEVEDRKLVDGRGQKPPPSFRKHRGKMVSVKVFEWETVGGGIDGSVVLCGVSNCKSDEVAGTTESAEAVLLVKDDHIRLLLSSQPPAWMTRTLCPPCRIGCTSALS